MPEAEQWDLGCWEPAGRSADGRDGDLGPAVALGRSPAGLRDSGAHRRPPPLEPLDRLGADERDGDELDDEGRVEPCEGALGLVVVELPAPVLVEGWVWVFPPDPVLLPDELPEPVDGATASGFEPEDRLGAEPVAPEPELGRTDPWPGVDGRCWVTVWPVLVWVGGFETR